MNILELEDTLKGIPDEVLMQEAQQPSGSAPQYLVISEIQRRSDMRERYASEQEQPQNTISDQIVNKGIASLGGSSAPSPSMNMQQPMAAAQPMTPPMTQQMMPEQPMAPTQMMNVGGEVMLDEAEDVTMLLDELGSSMNKIPENRERDLLMSDFSSSVLSDIPPHSQGLASNALREDASKFNPEQMMGADINELFAVQNVDSDLPEILNYAGGGIVELKNGGEVPEEEKGGYFSGDQGLMPDWAEENPWKATLAAADAAALAGLVFPEAVSSGLGGLWLGGRKALQYLPRLLGRRRLARKNPDELIDAVSRRGRVPLQSGLKDQGKPFSAMESAELRHGLGPTAGIGVIGATNYGTFFGDDDPNSADAAEAQMPDTYLGDHGEDDNGIIGAGLEPEPGSLEFVQQELAGMYKSGGEERQAKLDEILGRQREESELTKEQTRSDMVTSALMNLGAGIAAGDPSEGLRLAANAVDGIRSAAREGATAQQMYIDELELAGMDVNQAERAAALSSMAEIQRLQQQAAQTRSADVDNAYATIAAHAEALQGSSALSGNVLRDQTIRERTVIAMQLALNDPYNVAAFTAALMKDPDSGDFVDPDTGQTY